MRIAIVDGPTTLALLQELIPLTIKHGVRINVAWARPNRLIDTLLNHPDRIARLRYGTSFAHTNANTIEQLLNAGIDCHETMPSLYRVYHPKEYFLSGKNWSAVLIGSSNLTAGGLGGKGAWPGNVESSMFFFKGNVDSNMTKTNAVLKNGYGSSAIVASEGSLADVDIVTQWSAQSDANCAGFSIPVDQRHLNRYIRVYKAEQARKLQETHQRRQEKIDALTGDKKGWLLRLSWQNYLSLLKETPDELFERLALLGDTQDILRSANHRFTDISDANDRLAIAGVIKQRSVTSDPLNWFLFGNMSQKPDKFETMLIQPDAEWRLHIDTLSDTNTLPTIDEKQAQAIMIGLRRPGISVGRITRLMAMLRPAEFLPFSASNVLGLQRVLGLPKNEHARPSPDDYLRTLLPKLRSSPWHQQRFNAKWSVEDQTIWRCRTALVDMLVYGADHPLANTGASA